MAASMKCGGGHWNKARLKLFRAITIARAAQLVCVKNNRDGRKNGAHFRFFHLMCAEFLPAHDFQT
jgi:hypothetical protein